METISILFFVFMLLILSCLTFVFFRLKGISKLNNEIIDLIIKYTERHIDCKGLPRDDELFVSLNKKIFSLKKLTLENWVSVETIEKLKS